MDLSQLLAEGAKLGLQGHELSEWITRQQEIQHEEREEKSIQLKLRELEETQRENGHRRQLELFDAQTTSYARVKSATPVPYNFELRPFDDEVDELDAYLIRFERMASAYRVPKEMWALELANCLKGEALSLYGRLPYDEAMEYESLKNALSQRYNLTAERYRRRFEVSRPQRNETATQFATKLAHYIQRWLELSNVDKTLEGLCDLLVQDQLMKICNSTVSTFVKEHTVKSAKDASRLVDTYISAHGEYGLDSVTTVPTPCDDSDMTQNLCEVSRNKTETYQIRNIEPITRVNGNAFQPRKDPIRKLPENTRVKNELDSIQVTDDTPHCQDTVKEQEALNSDECGDSPLYASVYCTDTTDGHVTSGYVEGTAVSVVRDTDCSFSMIRESLVPEERFLGDWTACKMPDGSIRQCPEVCVEVDTAYFSGYLTALGVSDPPYDVILGNAGAAGGIRPEMTQLRCQYQLNENHSLPNLTQAMTKCSVNRGIVDKSDHTKSCNTTCNIDFDSYPSQDSSLINSLLNQHEYVEPAGDYQQIEPPRSKDVRRKARQCTAKHNHASTIPPNPSKAPTVREVKREQMTDPSLRTTRERVDKEETRYPKRCPIIVASNGLMYRMYKSKNDKLTKQVVVPAKYRNNVLRKCHECAVDGQRGYRQTLSKVSRECYWPSMQRDISRHIRSCKGCPNG